MPTQYSPLLGLALPVTGELSGTWGDTVNNYITTYLDSSVAGTQTISADTNTTLTVTNGSALGSTSAQYMLLNCTGARTAARTITLPASSRRYIVINATTGGFAVNIVGAGPTTGISVANGERCVIVWNGSDYVKVSSTVALPAGSTTQVQYNNAGALAGSSNLTFDGTTLVAANFTDSSLTSGRVTYATTGGNLTDSANLTFDGTNLTLGGGTANGVAYLNGSKVLTTGSALTFDGTTFTHTGASNFATSTGSLFVGTTSSAAGKFIVKDNSSGNNIWLIGRSSDGTSSVSFRNNADTAYNARIECFDTGVLTFGTGTSATERFRIASNGAWGLSGANYGTSGQVLTSNGSGSAPTWQTVGGGSAATPTALGTVYGLTQDASGTANTVLGYQGLNANTTGNSNVSAGVRALYTNTTGSRLTALGYSALYNSTTSSDNTAVGSLALLSNTTGAYNTAVGSDALRANTTASNNTAVGIQALYSNTTAPNNTASGAYALFANTTGSENTAFGRSALTSNTTASYNTAVGYQALYSNTTTERNIAIGHQAGYFNTAAKNLFIGYQAGYTNTTGTGNSFVGGSDSNNWPPGYYNTTGADNSAFGGGALRANTTGSSNVAIGTDALHLNTTASFITAVGREALYANTTGASNSALGYYALGSNSTGASNTAVGREALSNNTTASFNTAVGHQALTAANRTADTTGSNTAVGYQAGHAITTGQKNVCIGVLASSYNNSLTTGSSNVYVGVRPGCSAATVSNELVISSVESDGKGGSTGFINPNGGGVYQGNNSSSWSTTSDFRLKKNIVDNNEGLEKITAIKVRNFEYRTAEEVTELPAHTAINKTGVQLGVIAQELQQVCPDCVKEESTGVLSVDSDNVFWHMVNAIKQLKTELDSVKAELATLKGN